MIEFGIPSLTDVSVDTSNRWCGDGKFSMKPGK